VRKNLRKPPVIYLIGTAGHPNYGDELITAGWLRQLARTAPDAAVWLDTPRPGQSAVLFDGIHPGLRCVDTLFHACWNAPTDDPGETIAFGHRVIGEPGLLPREATAVEMLEHVDLVHIIGGGYVNHIWPHHLALVGAAQGIAARYGARTAMTGAGLTPLVPGSAGPLGAALLHFDVVDVRDEASHVAIRNLVPHATKSGDDAFLALDGGQVFGSEGAVGTMLCIQSDLVQLPLPDLADYVVRTLQAWGVDHEPVTLVECLPPDDALVMPLLEQHLPELRLLPFSQLWRSGFPAGPGQRWISTRFHAHLVAATAGAWGVAIPVSQDYYRTKHDSLLQLGSGWALAQDLVDPLLPPSSPVTAFGGRLSTLRAAKRQVTERVAGLVKAGRTT
jgi:hypothetical protein